jgi:hypothetical protein
LATATTAGAPYFGLLIATQGAGGVFTSLSITSMTFMDPLPAGCTAINFTGGTFLSTFTKVGFNTANIGANINAQPLAVASTIWMSAPAGPKIGHLRILVTEPLALRNPMPPSLAKSALKRPASQTP